MKALITLSLCSLVLWGCQKPSTVKRPVLHTNTGKVTLTFPHQPKSKAWRELNELGAEVIQFDNQLLVTLPTDKFFQSNTAELNTKAKPVLDHLVNLLNTPAHQKQRLVITAHSDQVGDIALRKAQTLSRVRTIAGFLWAHGVIRERIHQNTNPGHKNIAPFDDHINRRVTIHIFDQPEPKKIYS